MAYDEDLDRKLAAITEKDGMLRKKMFGGTCYLDRDGKMVCGVWRDHVILKVGETEAKKAIEAGRGKVFDITGRPMKAWIMVEGSSLEIRDIEGWIEKAKRHVALKKAR